MSAVKWTAEIEAHTMDDLIDRLADLVHEYSLRGRPANGTAVFASPTSKGSVTFEVVG